MAPRFDPAALTLELAVGDLLEAQLLRSLGFAHRGGYERMWLGQAIHGRYQEAALADDPTYQREVPLRLELEHRGWRIGIHGRVDGLRREGDVLVVEEIKSVRRSSSLAPPVREVYERQAALYAWMLGRLEGAEVQAELVLIEIGGEGVERHPVEVRPAALEAGVKRGVNALLLAFEKERQAEGARRAAGAELRFPYPSFRPGQEAIVSEVATALEHREHRLVEAPTGIGKTVAALYPAVRFALEHGQRIFVLTAKNLQQEMATAVLELLNQEAAFRSLRLRAKAKMCANDQVLCHEEYCPYARDYYQKLQKSGLVAELIERYPTLLPDVIYAAARAAEICPFEVSLELTGRAQVTVCDYNYAFEPYVSLSDFSAEADLRDTVLVVDEVHNLVDRGRGYYSPSLSAQAARGAAEEAARGGAEIHAELASLAYRLAELIEETVDEARPPGGETAWAEEQSLPEERLWRLRVELDRAFIDYLEHRRQTKTLTADDRFVDLYFDQLKFLNALALVDRAFSCYVERRPDGDSRLRILCKDPSRFLGQVTNRCRSVVGLSATLSPFEFYRDLLGFDADRTVPLRVSNPFPSEHRRVVIDATVATTYRERPENTPRIAERLAGFADAVPGNCLALFPSYDFLARVAARLTTSSKRILVQQPGDGDRQREEILETLRGALFGDVLLLAVAGGVFAEGVDYPGEMLKAVAVVGPCLPALTLDQQLLRLYYDERFDRGFEYAFVVPGMTRVVQAAGRLIRSAGDSGVIALFDRRFTRQPYREHLPADWLPKGGPRQLVGDPAEVAREFFAVAAPGVGTAPGDGL